MTEIFDITIKLKLATPDDLKENNDTMRYGQPFWLKGLLLKKFEGPYIIDQNSDPYEMATWLENNMIWVPAKIYNYVK